MTTHGYTLHLQTAISAARAAGDVLAAQFHKPRGPDGSGGHAAADEQAEQIIRRTLLEAFPSYGYMGEETGSKSGSDPSRHVWVVDPNDGTASYLKGFRGSAVSIALLHNGTPVLGVVNAFAAPTSGEDLIAWAEGCGPVTRNGRPVIRSWAAELSNRHVILVSQAADRCSLANAMLARPARFRAMPSIAYRAALVAVGDAEAAVSLNGPCGWDYAAGHALLLGAGGDMFDAQGNPITYTSEGRSGCGGRCFGGPGAILKTLCSRDWTSVQTSDTEGAFTLLRSQKGMSMADTPKLRRAQGCLLGQFAGDALGSLVEFKSSGQIHRSYPGGVRELADGGTWNTLAGQPTDDSELALMLARSIVKAGCYDKDDVIKAYVHWYDSRPFDIGGTTRAALGAASSSLARAATAAMSAARRDSQANGALMRISPLGIFGASLGEDRLAADARADAGLTHPHPVCADASALFAVSLAFAVRTGATPRQVMDHASSFAVKNELQPAVIQALEAARVSPPADFSTNMGWVLLALQNAFYQLLHADSFETGVVNTVNCGGDTDTNAAIAGALLGAVHSITAVPERWINRIITCRPLVGLQGVNRPRPKAFWPVDALELAERLLVLGARREGSGGAT